jgi:transporter family-2 protein
MPALLLLALVTGAGLAVQGATNSELRRVLGAPVLAALISFVVGTAALLVALLVGRERLPGGGAAGAVPWWGWIGGALGAAFVLMTVLVIPRAGAAATLGAGVAGQLLASVVLDSFGLLGVARHQLTVPRVAGVLLLLCGVVLVQRF